jgi:3-oxoadipate enol-lactonase
MEGRGEREMVLIHGLGGNADIWNECLPYLKGSFKVWTFELSGHGATQPILDPTIEKEAERLAAFLKEQGIAYPTLVGHGIGGMIALQYSLDHPADVHRLVMIDAAPKQLATQEQKAEVANALVENYDQFLYDRYSSMSPEPDITEQIVDMALRTHRVSFISLLMSSFDYDVTDRLHEFTVPLLVIGSELLFPTPDTTRQVLEQIGFGKARALVFKRVGLTGHYVMLERPPYTASVLLAFGVTSEHEFGY